MEHHLKTSFSIKQRHGNASDTYLSMTPKVSRQPEKILGVLGDTENTFLDNLKDVTTTSD
jgi:hypothetical protein